ncbi:MAG TPA: ATP-binding cassette domain-containing protein, partial [Ramlibacter sp.]
MSAITLSELDVSYGDTRVVHGVNLDITEGESFALMGESGSGKSTILRAIAGLAISSAMDSMVRLCAVR